MLHLYDNENIINNNINVEFIGEVGIDGGGLTKELFNIFFSKCAEQFFRGEDCLVPHLELNKQNQIDKFVIIGRILQHMILLTQTIPTKLSKITLMLIADPDKDINWDILLQELLNYANPYLRSILKKAIKNFDKLTSTEIVVVQDFYTSNAYNSIPKSDTLKDDLKIIATEILIEKPRKFISKLRQGVSPKNHSTFWNNCNFSVLIDMQTPTIEKIINCLKVDEDLTNEQNNTLHYFTMYIHNCKENEKLQGLIFLITGSYMMPDCINVKFNDLVSLSQRPIFATCTNTITLPETYTCYSDLKNDLNICINSEEATVYNTY